MFYDLYDGSIFVGYKRHQIMNLTYLVLYITGKYADQRVLIKSFYYFRIGQSYHDSQGLFRVLEQIEQKVTK